jgi:hypothetical protein
MKQNCKKTFLNAKKHLSQRLHILKIVKIEPTITYY